MMPSSSQLHGMVSLVSPWPLLLTPITRSRNAFRTVTEEGNNSNASPEHGMGGSKGFASFGGLSGGEVHDVQEEEDEDDEDEGVQGHSERVMGTMQLDDDMEENREDLDDDDYARQDAAREPRADGRGGDAGLDAGGPGAEANEASGNDAMTQGHGGLSNSKAGLPYGAAAGGGRQMEEGSFRNRPRDQAELERRANAHAYANGLSDAPREPSGFHGGGNVYAAGRGASDRHRPSNSVLLPPPPATSANGLSAIDSRQAAALTARTRLAAGGNAVPERSSTGSRPEAGPVLAGQAAAAAAAAALRRGPTPGSHSLPSMVLVPLEALKAHRRVPRSSDRK